MAVDLTRTKQNSTIGFNNDTLTLLDDRFGMFIHFGVYSNLAGIYKGKMITESGAEWIMRRAEISLAEYAKVAYDFNPQLDWAEKLADAAKKAGVKYAVLTTKHHDGFCLFKSNYSVYNSYNFVGRDLVKEYVDAMRSRGIKTGFYYSHTLDWAELDGGGRTNVVYPDYPAKDYNYWDYPDRESKDFSRYFYGKCLPQIRELLTNYGDVYLTWFDYPHDITLKQAQELYSLVKECQPHCVINSRIAYGYGDYNSLGDNMIPSVSLGVPNECLITLNDTWGYRSYDHNWKTDREVIGLLARCCSSETNLLMNVGPYGNGYLTPETHQILDGVGEWVKKNAQAVFGVAQNPFKNHFGWGSVAMNKAGDVMYAYLSDVSQTKLCFSGIHGKVKSVTEIGGKAQKYAYNGDTLTIFVDLKDKKTAVPVIRVEFDAAPTFSDIPVQNGDNLVLNPFYAKKYVVEKDITVNRELVFEYNIYDPMFGKRGLSIARNCTVSTWNRDDEYLEWTAEIKEGGEFECELVTAYMDGKAQPVVEIDGKTLSRAVSVDSADHIYNLSRTGGDNIRYVFKMGKISLNKGVITVFVKRKDVGDNLSLSELRFNKI